MSSHVGIRELRRDLSRYLQRVRRGERLVVTDRNRPVAMLTPLPENEDPWERMIAEGRITPASGNVLDLKPVKVEGDRYSGSKALEEVSREWWEDDPGG